MTTVISLGRKGDSDPLVFSVWYTLISSWGFELNSAFKYRYTYLVVYVRFLAVYIYLPFVIIYQVEIVEIVGQANDCKHVPSFMKIDSYPGTFGSFQSLISTIS